MANDIHRRVLDSDTGVELLVLDGSPVTVGLTAPKASMALDRTNSEAWLSQGAGAWTKFGLGSVSWASLTGKPTDVAGYGITDVYTKTAGDARYVLKAGDTMTGRLNNSASFGTSGQMRATGWYTGGDLAGLGAEIGVSASNIYFLGYNRTSSAYGNVYLQGLNVHLSPQGGTSYVDGDGTGNTGPGSPTSYWLRFQYSAADRFSIGADASYVYLQSWASLPLYLNSQGNSIYTGGKLMTQLAGATYGQGNTAPIELRSASGGGNSLIWGHSNPDYIHTFGTYYSAGYPYIAFHAYQATGDAFNRLGGSTLPFHLRYVSTTGYLEYFWGTAGTSGTGVTWTRKFYFSKDGDLGIEGSLYFTSGAVRVYDDGTYLNFAASPGRAFYVNSTFSVTYIYSASIYLGNTSGTGIHLRLNTLYFGASSLHALYSTEIGPVTYANFRIASNRGGYTGFYYDDWAYYVMNHATIYGLYHPTYSWRWYFTGSATGSWWSLYCGEVIMSAASRLFWDGGGDSYTYESSANVLDFIVGGVLSLRMVSTYVYLPNVDFLLAPTKKIYPDGGGDTYFYESSANVIDFYAGGSQSVRMAAASGTLYGAWAVTGALTLSSSLSVGAITATGDITATADVKVTGNVQAKKGTSTYRDVLVGEISSSAAPSATGYPTGFLWIQVTAPV